MNEKMEELLESVRRTANTVGEAASDAAYGVSRKATELLSTAKLNIRLNDLESQISFCLQEVGDMMYATHTGDPTDSDTLLEKLQEIDALKAQADALKAEIARIRGTQVCPVCGAKHLTGDAFCRECGAKL